MGTRERQAPALVVHAARRPFPSPAGRRVAIVGVFEGRSRHELPGSSLSFSDRRVHPRVDQAHDDALCSRVEAGRLCIGRAALFHETFRCLVAYVVPDSVFPGGILEEASELATSDLVEAARLASSKHPHLTAELWQGDKKVAICRPCWDHRFKHETR